MKKILLNPLAYLMLVLIVFTSCQEDEIDSIFYRTDGGLSAVIRDADGQAITDAKVSLFNIRSENRIDVAYTNQSGIVDFGRFESGEYSLSIELNHNEEYFQINQEVHVISGTSTQHEINIADHYGDLLIRILDSNTGQPIEFNPDAKIGLVPMDEDFRELTSEEGVLALIDYSFDSEGQTSVSDIPEAAYLVVMYTEDNIMYTTNVAVDPYEKEYANFFVNPTSLFLSSKESWVVSNVSANSNVDNIMPISSISFPQDSRMEITFENGEVDQADYYLGSNGSFDWYSVGTNTYNCYFNESYYEINSDGSITFYFSYWETYNYNDGSWYSSDNVSITLN